MKIIRNYYSFWYTETYNKNFVFISCEYFYLIKFFFHFVQMNISFQTIGKLLNLFSIDITYVHTPYESDKKVIVKASAKKKKIRFKMVYTHICVRSNFHYKKTKRKEEKKKRILLPVRTHPRENKLIEWIHARVPRKSFIRSFTYLRHVWFSVEGEYYNAYVSIKVYVVCSNDVVHDWISRKYAIERRVTRKKKTY